MPIRDVPFLVAAGAALVLPFGTLIGLVMPGVGFSGGIYVGGAVAIAFYWRLRATRTPLRIGCAVILGWIAVTVGGVLVAGPVGMAIGGTGGLVAAVAVAVLVTRRYSEMPHRFPDATSIGVREQ